MAKNANRKYYGISFFIIEQGAYSLEYYQNRLLALDRDKKCNICSKNFDLVCHHIDYNTKNNILDNLIILCRSCHGKTNKDRNYWQQHFLSPGQCSH